MKWAHRKNGTLWDVISDCASLECSTYPQIESATADENWTVYRNVKTGSIYVRLTNEFQDGRFVAVAEDGDNAA